MVLRLNADIYTYFLFDEGFKYCGTFLPIMWFDYQNDAQRQTGSNIFQSSWNVTVKAD